MKNSNRTTDLAKFRQTLLDPVLFQQSHLRVDNGGKLQPRKLWARQQDICRAVATSKLTSVKGCHASGKSFVAGGLILWWLSRYRDGKVFLTGPTLRQVKTFWRDVAIACQHSRIKFPEPSTTGLEIRPDCYAVGASSSRGVNTQGLHGPHVLIIVDEAPGVQQDIWDAIDGIQSGGQVHILKLGNPTVPSGSFFDDFRHPEIVKGITISAFDTPNLQNSATGKPFTIAELKAMTPEELAYNPVPWLVQRWWVLDKYIRWGPDNPRYMSRVLGQFPTQSNWAVFSLEWIEAAKREPTESELAQARGHHIQVGIDVAGGGEDETTLCARVDGIILRQRQWSEPDPAGSIIRELREIQATNSRLYPMGKVVMDVVGIGMHLAPRIAEAGFAVVGFQAGGRAMDAESFANAKAEAYWTARGYLKDRLVSNLDDDETAAQLAGIQYEEPRGRVLIESKEDAAKRGVKSPDRAEAFIMSLIPVVERHREIELGMDYRISAY